MKYNSIGEQLIAKAKELDPSYKPDKFNDMSEAINIILNNSDSESIFDITPYMTSLSTISVEGYNALREFVTNHKGGIVNANLGDNILSFYLSGILEDSLQFVWCNPYENSEYDVGYMRVIISSNGHLTIDNLILNQVLANPTESATESLSKVRIGNSVYDIQDGGGREVWYPLYPDENNTITQEEYNEIKTLAENNQLVGVILNNFIHCPLYTHTSGFFTFLAIQCQSDLRSKTISYITINSNLTITLTETTILSSVNSEITEQVIPSITSTGQKNLKIGDGLTIENGVLKTNKIPELPSDASTKTYVLKSVNGVLTWSE